MKISPIVRLIIYASITLFLSAFYDSWSATTTILVRFGVYRNACPADTPAPASPDLPYCDEQLRMLSGLLSVFRISEFVSSIGVGILMDILGPKSCIGLGFILRMLGWVLLVYFPHYNVVMIMACIICGISVNAVIFPVFTIARYWPMYQDMAMCVISACLSAGTYYTPVLNWILSFNPNTDMPNFVWYKLLITHVPWLIVSLIIFPNNVTTDVEKNLHTNKDKNETDGKEKDASWNFRTFLKYIINPEVVMVTLVFILNCVSFTFTQEAFTIVYVNNKTAEQFNSIMIPTSFVFSILFMWVVNQYGVTIVILGLNIVSMAAHVFLLSGSTAAAILTSICISLAFSGFITYFFIMLEHIVEILYSGSIKGYLTTVAGISLAVNPLMNYLIARYDSMNACQTVFIVIRAFMILPILWLMKRESDRRKLLRPTEDIMATPTVSAAAKADVAQACHLEMPNVCYIQSAAGTSSEEGAAKTIPAGECVVLSATPATLTESGTATPATVCIVPATPELVQGQQVIVMPTHPKEEVTEETQTVDEPPKESEV
ncbi:major facilitator superfamily protein MFS-1 [Babesia ovis]|uniref:Major facilitator superfamily protein MFS-1 n=1 Tax=Babesia ovis TaxID=5869 RepID=A0A9W5TCS6_BABOV|nr:major facilitator superfamily protein MFS-1 [Babesia ovis]